MFEQEYEYKVVEWPARPMGRAAMEAEVNAAAVDGFRLVSTLPVGPDGVALFFERPAPRPLDDATGPGAEAFRQS
jgi:Domain of unknown function (DUF4177)